jgi:hypothetical protein
MAIPTITICELLTRYDNQSQRVGRFASVLGTADCQGSFYMNSALFYSGRAGTGGSLPLKPSASDNPLIVDLTEKAIALKPSPGNVFRCYDSTSQEYREKTDLAVQGILLYLDALPAQGSVVTAANLVFKFDCYIASGQKIELTANFEEGTPVVAGPFEGGVETRGVTLEIPMSLGQTRKLLSFTITNEASSPSPASADLFLMTQGSDGIRRVQPTNTWTLPVPVSFTRVDPAPPPSGLVTFLSSKAPPPGYTSLGAKALLSAFEAPFSTISPAPPADIVGIGSSSICLDGKLYISGGMIDGAPTKGFLCYDIDADTWDSSLAQMPEARAYHRMVVVGDDILVVHGLESASGMAQYTLVYDPDTDAWSKSTRPYSFPRYDAAIAELDGVVYCFGGLNIKGTATEFQNQCSSINMSGGNDPIEVNLTIRNDNFKRRHGATAVTGPDGIYIIGGKDSANSVVSGRRVDAYSPITNRYQRVATLARERMHHAACAIEDRVYVIGGENLSGTLWDPSQSEVFSMARGPGRIAATVPITGMPASSRLTAAAEDGFAYVSGGDSGGTLVAPGWIPLDIALYAMKKA